MTFTTGYPSDGTAVATLVIPRVFGDNGHRSGVTNDHVFQVMSSQKWGLIQGIDCHDKKDFRTGENFRMMFVRWTHFAPPVEVKKALDDGGHIEIDIDDYGHFWKIRNFVPRVKTHAQETTNETFHHNLLKIEDMGLQQSIRSCIYSHMKLDTSMTTHTRSMVGK